MSRYTTRVRNVVHRLVHSELPLAAPRVVFSLLLFVFSIVSGGLCLKVWTKHHTSQKHLNENLPSGISAGLAYQDVRTTSILLFVSNHLVTFLSSHIAIIILHDVFKIIPPFVLRRVLKKPPTKPLSSVTLPYQVAGLLGSSVCLVMSASFHTQFVFTRVGKLVVRQDGIEAVPETVAMVQSILDRLGFALRYRDVQYIRISAEMPWPAVFFAVGANVLTGVAWYRFRCACAAATSAEQDGEADRETATNSEVSEKSLPVGIEDVDPEKNMKGGKVEIHAQEV